MTDPTNPLIVQGDLSVLAEVASPRFEEARSQLARFAELEKAPEHIHTYRITPLSLWNAAVAGLSSGDVAATITDLAKYPVAPSVLAEVHDQMSRYGRLRLVRDHDTAALALTSAEPALLEEVSRDKQVAELLGDRLDGNRFAVRAGDRGVLKQALIRLGWPAADEAGYERGARLEGPSSPPNFVRTRRMRWRPGGPRATMRAATACWRCPAVRARQSSDWQPLPPPAPTR